MVIDEPTTLRPEGRLLERVTIGASMLVASSSFLSDALTLITLHWHIKSFAFLARKARLASSASVERAGWAEVHYNSRR